MSSEQGALKYRPDIDGLRAIAVLSVVLFHAQVSGIGGGYVGVDVFFVISGYLITVILLGDQSIVRFYQRRARRILPALFALLAAVLAAGLLIYLPHDLIELSKSAGATLLFFSNVLFWRKSGYFATETELWPLLHTWSLGVEEQFYIVFPLLVRLFRFLPRRRMALLFVVLGAISFGAAAYGMSHRVGVMVFYLVPTRAWELLVGSILATGAIPKLPTPWARSAAALAGLAAVLLPIFLYTKGTSFPGIGALPPVLGSALILWAGQDGEHFFSRALGWRPVRFIGLISYSLYLWHWPLLAMARYVAVRDLNAFEIAIAVAAAFAFATLSWRYVERPFRRGYSDRAIWIISLAGIASLLLVCGSIIVAKGLPGRFPRAIVALNEQSGTTWRCPVTSFIPIGSFYACPVNLPSRRAQDADIVLWGDSHAQMYVPALRPALGGRRALLINANGCAPVLSDAASPTCGVVQRANYAEIIKLPAKTVILAQNWVQYRDEAAKKLHRDLLPSERYQDAIRRMRVLVAALRSAGKQVIIVGPVPEPGYDLASVASRDLLFHGRVSTPVSVTSAAYLNDAARVLAAIEDLAKQPGVKVIRVDRMVCNSQSCDFMKDGRAIFSDHDHYTADFSQQLAPLFAEALQR